MGSYISHVQRHESDCHFSNEDHWSYVNMLVTLPYLLKSESVDLAALL